MTDQPEIFHEDWRDALQHTVRALGGYDTVGHELWPGMKRSSAGKKLWEALQGDRSGKLDLEEIVHLHMLAKDAGVHLAMHSFCDDVGYSPPKPVSNSVQQAEIESRIDRHVSRLEKLFKAHEKIQQANVLKMAPRQ